jgi:hypothetical protein
MVEQRRKQGDVLTLFSRTVCGRNCNSGWMKRLEDRARPALVRMLEDASSELSVEEAGLVATWASKTGLMIDQTDPKLTAAPPEHRRWIMENDEPPPMTRVWVSRAEWWVGAQVWKRSSYVAPASGPVRNGERYEPNSYMTVFALGRVIFEVLGTTEARVSKLGPPQLLQDKFTRLWPAPAAFSWPPTADLTATEFVGCYDGHLVALADRARRAE